MTSANRSPHWAALRFLRWGAGDVSRLVLEGMRAYGVSARPPTSVLPLTDKTLPDLTAKLHRRIAGCNWSRAGR